MYTSSFYATATGKPNPPFSIPFDSNKLPVEYEKSTYLLTVHSLYPINSRKIILKLVIWIIG